MREFRRLFAGIFCCLLLIEASLLVIALRERRLRQDSLTDQFLLLQAREAIDTELDQFIQLSDLALKAATTGDTKQAKAHEDLLMVLMRPTSASSNGPTQLPAAEVPSQLQHLQGEDSNFRSTDFSSLSRAIEDAKLLLQSDRKALHAIRGLHPDPDGAFTVRGKSDPTLLLALLTDESSAQKRKLIRSTLSNFLAALDVRIYASVEENTVAIQRYSQLLSYLVGVLLVSTVAAGIFLYRNISEPLRSFRNHSRKINDDLARTLAQLEEVGAERDALRKKAGTHSVKSGDPNPNTQAELLP